MQDYTGMFEKVAGDVVWPTTEDTARVKEASYSEDLFNFYDKQGKDRINMAVDRAKANLAAPGISGRGKFKLRANAYKTALNYLPTRGAQKAKPTGFVSNMIRKAFGK